jgi:hypothetical protein
MAYTSHSVHPAKMIFRLSKTQSPTFCSTLFLWGWREPGEQPTFTDAEASRRGQSQIISEICQCVSAQRAGSKASVAWPKKYKIGLFGLYGAPDDRKASDRESRTPRQRRFRPCALTLARCVKP